jgi:hypothetical protein
MRTVIRNGGARNDAPRVAETQVVLRSLPTSRIFDKPYAAELGYELTRRRLGQAVSLALRS